MKISLSITRIAAVSLLALALSPLTSMAAAAKETKSVAAGSKWEVDQITTLSELTIAEGATVTAGQGQSLTLTVNGVETPIKAGTYKGIVVLTPTKDLAIHFSEQGMTTDFKYRQGIYIRDGAYVPEQSVAAAVASGKVTNTAAEKVKITSTAERFNALSFPATLPMRSIARRSASLETVRTISPGWELRSGLEAPPKSRSITPRSTIQARSVARSGSAITVN